MGWPHRPCLQVLNANIFGPPEAVGWSAARNANEVKSGPVPTNPDQHLGGKGRAISALPFFMESP
jgi:hypothetical protein